MKIAPESARAFAALQKKLPPAAATDAADRDDPIAVLVQSFFMYDSPTDKALAAYQRLREQIVDFNDLRVCMPHEVVSYVGSRFPKALERCQRMRATLRDVYLREHAVTLERLKGGKKRDVKRYVESLDGILPYVAARVMLLCFDTHAIPTDERLCAALAAEAVVDPSADVGQVSAWLARQVKAEDAIEMHGRLQAWADRAGAKGGRSKGGRKTAPRGASKEKKGAASRKSGGRSSGRSASARKAAGGSPE